MVNPVAEMTDSIEMEVVGPGIPANGQMRHGSATWRITGPLLLMDSFAMGTATIEQLHFHSFHAFDEADLTEVAQRALNTYLALRGTSEIVAQATLPRFVRVTMLLTISTSEIISHLLEWHAHPEVVQTINGGILQTVRESDPALAEWIEQQVAVREGVLDPPSDQEKIANQQEVQHVQGC